MREATGGALRAPPVVVVRRVSWGRAAGRGGAGAARRRGRGGCPSERERARPAWGGGPVYGRSTSPNRPTPPRGRRRRSGGPAYGRPSSPNRPTALALQP